MKKLFDVPDSYKEHITKFDSSDGFLALGIIVTYFVVMTISGIIVQYISQLQITIIGVHSSGRSGRAWNLMRLMSISWKR